MKSLIASLLGAWFVAVSVLGAKGAFVRPPEVPPLPILFGVLLPLTVFGAWYWKSSAFRESVRTADLRLLVAIQAWRAGGLAFLALSANGILPGRFAWPAGLGDIAIGVTAPWVALALVQNPGFIKSRFFTVWNVLGILDLVVAVSMGALSTGFVPALAGTLTTAAMSRLPLVLIPAYLVPLFVMLHIAALIQARRYAGATSMSGGAVEAEQKSPFQTLSGIQISKPPIPVLGSKVSV
jgi:hypothetical protein